MGISDRECLSWKKGYGGVMVPERSWFPGDGRETIEIISIFKI